MPRVHTGTSNPMGKRPGTPMSMHGMPRFRTRGLGVIAVDITQDSFLLPGYGNYSFSPGTPVATKIAILQQNGIPPSLYQAPHIIAGPISVSPQIPLSPGACAACSGSPGSCDCASGPFIGDGPPVFVTSAPDLPVLPTPVTSAPDLPLPPAPSVVQMNPLPLVATAPAATPAATITNPPLTPAPAPQNIVAVNQVPSSPQIAAAAPGPAAPQLTYDPVTGAISVAQPSTFSSFMAWLESSSIMDSVISSEVPGSGLPNWGILGALALAAYAMSGSSGPARRKR